MRQLRLTKRACARIENGHVWVYREELPPDAYGPNSETVLLRTPQGALLGTALLDPESNVPVRLVARKEIQWNLDSVLHRLRAALHFRDQVLSKDTNAYRLVHSEGDGLPGLIIDRFGDGLAIQLNMRNYEPMLPSLIAELHSWAGGNLQLGKVVVEQKSGRRILGEESSTMLCDYTLNGLKFQADLVAGPKTGAFLDQRENYARLEAWLGKFRMRGAGLDLFSSSGGFALHAARAGLKVMAIDSSPLAVQRIQQNAQLNELTGVQAIKEDVNRFLRGMANARRNFEFVVVDPPAFAKQAKNKHAALEAYRELNRRALSCLKEGALLVTCSCSAAISADDFREMIQGAARDTRKSLTLLEEQGQAVDHKMVLEIP